MFDWIRIIMIKNFPMNIIEGGIPPKLKITITDSCIFFFRLNFFIFMSFMKFIVIRRVTEYNKK